MTKGVSPQGLSSKQKLNQNSYDNVEITTWSKLEELFYQIDRELYDILKDLSFPDSEFPLVKVSFPYGFPIYKNGVFYLPLGDEEPVPINSEKVPNELKDLLSYNPLPLGFVVKNGFEVFHESENNIYPVSFRKRGLELGIWEMFAEPSPYTVTSGARLFTVLPRLTDSFNHKKLSALGVKAPVPSNPFDFWNILKQISRAEVISPTWTCDIIFFSKSWIDKMKSNKQWLKFNHYTLQKSWEHTELVRFGITLNAVWDDFSKKLTKNKIKINTYIGDIFKRLIYIASGFSPGFMPASAVSDLDVAPFDDLLHAYLDVYKLKNYIPTIMCSNNFSIDSGLPAYYSLHASTCLHSNPLQKVSISARKDLLELIYFKDLLTGELSKGTLGSGSNFLYDLFSKVDFEFYHSEPALNHGIYPSSSLPIDDDRLMHLPEKYQGNKLFCERSSFVKGCIKIVKK